VPGIGRRTAEAIVAALNDEAPTPAQDGPAEQKQDEPGERKAEQRDEPEVNGQGETRGESLTPDHPDQAAT